MKSVDEPLKLEKQIEKDNKTLEKLNFSIQNKKNKLAELLCPYKIGQILEFKWHSRFIDINSSNHTISPLLKGEIYSIKYNFNLDINLDYDDSKWVIFLTNVKEKNKEKFYFGYNNNRRYTEKTLYNHIIIK